MRRLAFLVLALSAGTAALAGDNWPQFRGPNGDGISDANGLPTKWSESENVRWKVAVHDKGWSSPVVWGEQVWVTTAHEKGKAFYAVCLDRKTGSVVHDLKLFEAANPTDISQYNSYASPTPAIEAGRIYAHFGSYGTACLDTATGKKLWERTDLPCDHWRAAASSPVIYKDRLFLLFDGYDKQYVVCLNKANGDTIWRKDRVLPYPDNGDLKKAFATPSVFEVDGKAQVVAPAAVGTIAYDVGNGDEVWRVIHGGMNEAIRPILAHGLIYLNSGHTKHLLAVRAGMTGDLTQTGIAWRADKVSSTRPSPIVVGDHLYMVNDDGVAFCYEAKTGKRLWQERLDGKFSASPVFAGGHLYFPAENGKTSVVAASPTFNLVAENRLAAGCRASPAVAGDALFLRTYTHVYCIGGK
jgi:outer membrane protein assembly factor BamB